MFDAEHDRRQDNFQSKDRVIKTHESSCRTLRKKFAFASTKISSISAPVSGALLSTDLVRGNLLAMIKVSQGREDVTRYRLDGTDEGPLCNP